ncbi:unnamed protein product [Durusdinium trenchii]|uniref:Uncharacterized protein n=1 Tax=Durusdinium trenchii TaxID=1381693 RepID=A0ABP0RWB6_9DINO
MTSRTRCNCFGTSGSGLRFEQQDWLGGCSGQTIVALQARQQDGLSEEWIDIKGSKAKFGAKTPFQVALAGAPDLAASWLYGDEPGPCQVACVRTEPLLQELEEPNSPMQVYKFSLPALDLMGLGRATSSINLFGAIRGAECIRYLEIGTFGNPQANIRFATGMDLALPVFSLNVTGELRIMKDGFSEKRSSATGWVAIEVQGEVPSLAGITLPEEVLRGAAREACRQTCAYASRKLEQELSEDFARWRAEKVRRERRRVTA